MKTFFDAIAARSLAISSLVAGSLLTVSGGAVTVSAIAVADITGALTWATSQNASLTAGSSGANLTLSQGTNGAVTLTAAGSGNVVLASTSGSVTTSRPLTVTNSTVSTSTSTGALIVSGGAGFGGSGFFGGTISGGAIVSTTSLAVSSAATTDTAALDLRTNAADGSTVSVTIGKAGGLNFGAQGFIGYFVNTATPASAFFFLNHAGDSSGTAGFQLFKGGIGKFTASTTSSSTSTGALVVSGGVGIGGNLYGGGNLVMAGTVIHSLSATPASSSAAGTTGTLSWDASYLYVCTGTNTWKRAALSTW